MENFISPLRFKKSNYVFRLFSNKVPDNFAKKALGSRGWTEKKEKKEKVLLCESIGHRPLRGRCPKEGESSPVWKHRSSAPSGPLPKKGSKRKRKWILKNCICYHLAGIWTKIGGEAGFFYGIGARNSSTGPWPWSTSRCAISSRYTIIHFKVS